MEPINAYIKVLREKLKTGIAKEPAYRPALDALLKSLAPALTPVNDPERIKCGAPDFIITTKAGIPHAYVEAKDIDENLGKVARTN
jgi:hypothetical protein